MIGRFLELAIATTDIAASVQFYERLGFERHGYSFRLMLEQVPA